MTDHARLLADARARWDAGDFDPSSPSARATLSQITSTPVASVMPRRNRAPRRLAAAVIAVTVAVSVAAITIPGATPDVIARAAAALGDSAGEGIAFSGVLHYGDDGDTGNAVRVEGSQKGAVGSLGVHGGVPGGLDEARGLGSRLTFFQVALPELRDLLERASAGEDDSVRVVGETTVAGRDVYELRVDRQDGASWTLYVDRENYLPVRFEIYTPSGGWATLDFAKVERVSSDERSAEKERLGSPEGN
jgi:hypothetical protein